MDKMREEVGRKLEGEKVLNRLEIIEIKEAKLLGKNITNGQRDFNNDSPLLNHNILNCNLGP